MDRGHRLSRQELSVEQRDSVASLTSEEEIVLEDGRAELARAEKWLGARLHDHGRRSSGLLGRSTLN